MKYIRTSLIALCIVCCLALCACSPQQPADPNDIVDIGSDLIMSAQELASFLANSTESSCELGANIEMYQQMLTLSAERGHVTINGNGHAITGDADCMLRLDDGASITINDVTLSCGSVCIGGLGSAVIYGNDLVIDSVSTGIYLDGDLTIGDNSNISITSSNSACINAYSILFSASSHVECTSLDALHTINAHKSDITIDQNAAVRCSGMSYSVLYCERTLVMRDGSSLSTVNGGIYHGAEIGKLSVDGVVTINATGGEQGVGVFLFELREHLYVVGTCEPAYRYDLGRGSITFVESAADIPTPTPSASLDATPAATPG
ncbi:MAG: hypothetical protein Q4B99_02535 [Clostridia bacterium]|nr:hypothetical protein [Clostridia bacterium]